MPELMITVRDADIDTLANLAEQQWRTPECEASALLEQILHTQRARSTATEKPRKPGRRANGVEHTVTV